MTSMTPTTRTGLYVLGAGLAVGLVSDLLLPVEPWGLNMLLATTALVGAGAWVVRRAGLTPSSDIGWLTISVLLLSAAFLRRDAEALQVFDIGAMIVLFGLASAAAVGVSLRRAEVGRYLTIVGRSALSTWTGALQLVFSDVAWRDIPLGDGRLKRVRGVALGVALALPLLVVFGTLFSSADPKFGEAVGSILRVDMSNVLAHTMRTVVLGGLAAGYLRGIVFHKAPLPTAPAAPLQPPSAERATPAVTALILLNALFLAFVLVQLRYFFGGAGRVETIAGLTFSEYARKGFFELVWATAFVVPVLLGGDWIVRGAGAIGLRRFRIASTVTLGLMGVIVASALERMRLYVAAYGLTEDRLYATAAMIFLSVLLGWLGWTVLRGQASRFAFGGLLQGLAVLGGLHALNPDAYVLRHNLTRPAAERPFDVEYATQLSADAAPLLREALPRLSPADACVAAKFLASWNKPDADWRTWNWSRSRAALLARDPLVIETVTRCQLAAPASTPDT